LVKVAGCGSSMDLIAIRNTIRIRVPEWQIVFNLIPFQYSIRPVKVNFLSFRQPGEPIMLQVQAAGCTSVYTAAGALAFLPLLVT